MTHEKKRKPPSSPVLLRAVETAFHMETRGLADGSLLCVLLGARRILAYSPERMAFDCGRLSVSLEGEGLVCRTFLNGTVEISGFLSEIRYERISKNTN